jgi:hypothetical protein
VDFDTRILCFIKSKMLANVSISPRLNSRFFQVLISIYIL